VLVDAARLNILPKDREALSAIWNSTPVILASSMEATRTPDFNALADIFFWRQRQFMAGYNRHCFSMGYGQWRYLRGSEAQHHT
jgi:hypothetical protein